MKITGRGVAAPLIAAATCVSLLSGCGLVHDLHPDGTVSGSFGPVTISVDTTGKVHVSLGARWATPIGTFEVSGGVTPGLGKPKPHTVQVLVRERDGSGFKDHVVELRHSSDHLHMLISGKAEEDITTSRVLVKPVPGKPCTIKFWTGSQEMPEGLGPPAAQDSPAPGPSLPDASPPAAPSTEPPRSEAPGTEVSLDPSSSPGPSPMPSGLTGTWQGTITGSTSAFEARLTLWQGDYGERVGSADYPGLDCSGGLTLANGWSDPRNGWDTAEVEEDITRDPAGHCTRQGRIRFTVLGADRVRYDYWQTGHTVPGAPPDSTGMLLRTGS